ncbi:hypothetical protein [uncultured Polaribacter sp.]|uniref:hypothetical protein n=1 Tax=uncultured Polaribacter sp. TaxID=174711 RepID=UPI0030DD1E7E|tara:strand:+ start:1748 stop:2332 length:585 start_codon:yes stop_codon:yes gene_type:complete
MKTIKNRVLVVVFMLVTLCNYANNVKDFNEIVNAKKVKVVFDNVKKGQQLTVKDNNGTELHSESVKSEGELIKFFDLSSLNDGIYTIELNKYFTVAVKILEVKNKNVVIVEDSEKVIFKPIIKNKEDLVLISKIDFDKKPLKVAIFFNGSVIFSETIKGEIILQRAYRLDKNIKGDYKVVVYCEDDNYTNEFTF